jgi:anti-sigma-K factor RskA
VIDLTQRLNRWRTATAAIGALAATLMMFVALQEFTPDILPSALRPKVPAARLIAVLQRDETAPAFLLTVDTAARTMTVRRVAAGIEPGYSYELWMVSPRLGAPRSLGIVGNDEFTQRPLLASYDPDTINSATYAVSLEPEGGSRTGAPTGPVLWTGRLVEATPKE